MYAQKLSDKAAIFLSFLCVVHCLCLPVLLLLLPALAGVLVFNDAWFHLTLLFFVVPVSSLALVLGYFHHRNYAMLLVGALGLSLLIVAAVAGHDILGEFGEVVLTVIGSSIIVYSHLRNLKLSRQTAVNHHYAQVARHN